MINNYGLALSRPLIQYGQELVHKLNRTLGVRSINTLTF